MRVPSSGSVSESTALPEKHEVVSDHFRFKLPDRVCIHHKGPPPPHRGSPRDLSTINPKLDILLTEPLISHGRLKTYGLAGVKSRPSLG